MHGMVSDCRDGDDMHERDGGGMMKTMDKVFAALWIVFGTIWAVDTVSCMIDGADWVKSLMLTLYCVVIITFYIRIYRTDDEMRMIIRISDESCLRIAREISEELRK